MPPPLLERAKQDSNSHQSRPKSSRVRYKGPMRNFVTKLDGAISSKTGCRETSLGGIAQHVTPIYIARSFVCARSNDPPLLPQHSGLIVIAGLCTASHDGDNK